MYKKVLAVLLALVIIFALLASCAKREKLFISEDPVVLTVAGGWTECRALDESARAFNEKYPNCTINYEYLQDYYPSVVKRMSGESKIDLFFTTNIQEGSELLPYVQDLNACDDLDLSETFDGLIQNFIFREQNQTSKKLYAVPLGAEMRGLYINKTLLDSLSIEIPTNQTELLAACKTLFDNGYIPFHGNPGAFSQTLIYPWICNIIANSENYSDIYKKIEAREEGVSELFREPYEFLYTLVENGYYNYKKAQTELDLFNETTDDDYARYFLNIKAVENGYEKVDDIGQVAFMPSPMSLNSLIEKTKDDYHSGIEYVFVPAPVSEQGGYVYLSPAHGIAVNKASDNTEWSIRFLDFLFQSENNQIFAKNFNVIPNTKEAFSYVRSLYDIPDERISQLGQVTFSYGFYEKILPSMVDLSKANNPKYMKDNGDGTSSMYDLNYYMDELEGNITEK